MEHGMIVAILGALLALSEVLAFLPAVKSNGIFQLCVNLINQAIAFIKK